MIELVSKIMPGIGEMANFHPMAVHFPIGLLNGFVLMELLGFLLKKEELKTAAAWMLYLGALGAFVTVWLGFAAADSAPHGGNVHSIMTNHRNLGVIVFFLSMILSIWRVTSVNKGRVAQLVIGFVMVVIMAFGADLGGLMVYKYGVAVKAAPQPKGHLHSEVGHKQDNTGHDEIDEFADIKLEEEHSNDGHDHQH